MGSSNLRLPIGGFYKPKCLVYRGFCLFLQLDVITDLETLLRFACSEWKEAQAGHGFICKTTHCHHGLEDFPPLTSPLWWCPYRFVRLYNKTSQGTDLVHKWEKSCFSLACCTSASVLLRVGAMHHCGSTAERTVCCRAEMDATQSLLPHCCWTCSINKWVRSCAVRETTNSSFVFNSSRRCLWPYGESLPMQCLTSMSLSMPLKGALFSCSSFRPLLWLHLLERGSQALLNL